MDVIGYIGEYSGYQVLNAVFRLIFPYLPYFTLNRYAISELLQRNTLFLPNLTINKKTNWISNSI